MNRQKKAVIAGLIFAATPSCAFASGCSFAYPYAPCQLQTHASVARTAGIGAAVVAGVTITVIAVKRHHRHAQQKAAQKAAARLSK